MSDVLQFGSLYNCMVPSNKALGCRMLSVVLTVLAFLDHLGSVEPSSLLVDRCQRLPIGLRNEIRSYKPIVDQIVSAAVNGKYSGRLYKDLEDFVDKFGNRIAGSENLEAAIDDVTRRLDAAGLQVHTETAIVPNWLRGEESAELISPRRLKLDILGLGLSPGTDPEGVTAQVLAVTSFEELAEKASEVPGKIVLFNGEFVEYKQTVAYRSSGPSVAGSLGAVAVLVRSIAPFSIATPHTGTTDDAPIPAAALSLEHADLIARLCASGINVTVALKMGATRGPDKISRNVVGDLRGRGRPYEYVTLSGHIDSWDVGQGAMDDGGGAFLAWHSVALIKSLKLPPTKRTIRAILWTAEEQGYVGAYSYLKDHPEQIKHWTAAIESDEGVFQALGLKFAGNPDATCIIQHIVSLFAAINATKVLPTESAGSDIEVFGPLGVPLAEAYMIENRYFWFHHTQGDSLRVLDSKDLDQNLALFAGVAYILGDLSIKLPREKETADLLVDASQASGSNL